MANKKLEPRTFKRMGYRQVQRKNYRNRNQLTAEHQKWLKDNGYRNIGWSNVISLYEKIIDLQDKERIHDFSLEELFLEADRIGNKYFTNQEINERHKKIAIEVNQIAEIIDLHFPDNKLEIFDYSKNNKKTLKSIY